MIIQAAVSKPFSLVVIVISVFKFSVDLGKSDLSEQYFLRGTQLENCMNYCSSFKLLERKHPVYRLSLFVLQ